MPAGFTLVRHVLRTYLPNRSGKQGNLEPSGRPAGAHVGILGNPIEENSHKGFIQLEYGIRDTASSIEGPFNDTSGTGHYGNTYPGQIRDAKEEGEEVGFPLHQIDVKDDIHTHGLSGWNCIERGAD